MHRLKNCGTRSCVYHSLEPVPAELFVRAHVLLSQHENSLRMRVAASRAVRAVVFNAEGFINSPTDAHTGVQVSAARVKRYTNSLVGNLVTNKPVTDTAALSLSTLWM